MSSFFSMILRMKYINRWGLMRNNRMENLSEHSLDVAVITHALAVIRNKRLGGSVNAERAALLALYHDTEEIITGDLPTPIKYFNSDINTAFKNIENIAGNTLLDLLPEDLKSEYAGLFNYTKEDADILPLIKAADKLAALIKCIEEETSGNREFINAKRSTLEIINNLSVPEAKIFLEDFIPSFYLTLDEHNKNFT